MKRKLFALTCLAFPLFAFTQKQISVEETIRSMSKGSLPSFQTEIPQGSLKEVEKNWTKYLNGSSSKGKVSNLNGEIIQRSVVNNDISKKPFHIYSKLAATSEGVSLGAWFTHDDTVFFSGKLDRVEANKAQEFVHIFAVAQYFEALKNEFKHEREKLEKQKDELEKTIRDEEKSDVKINQNRRAVTRALEDNATLDNDRGDISEEINAQKKVVDKERNSNADAYKEAEKKLKELEESKKKFDQGKESNHKKMDAWNKEIAAEERDIAKSKQAQQTLSADIEKQKQIIKNVDEKLKNINK